MKDQPSESQAARKNEIQGQDQSQQTQNSLSPHSSISITLSYVPLDQNKLEIRIFRLFPDGANLPIRGELCHAAAPPSKMPSFTALSYCWGDPHDLVPITVNNTTIFVTRNLESGLRELRGKGFRDLWVDALCINQQDGNEKGHQILRMRDIYRHAVSTIAWLGPDEGGHSEKAFGALEHLSSKTPSSSKKSEARVGHAKPDWSEFEELVTLPYWHRTWIVQEVALSPTVIVAWGHATISLQTLRSSLLSIWGERPPSALVDDNLRDYISLLNLMYILDKARKPMDVISALRYSCTSLASVKRDKIFGILGLCMNASLVVPTPDYTVPFHAVITDMNKMILLHECGNPGDLDLLCLGNPRTSRKQTPSWGVPWQDIWNDPHPRAWTSRADRGLKAGYTACSDSKAEISFPGDGLTLRCYGYILDCITELSMAEFSPNAQNLGNESVFDENIYGSEPKLYEALWQSMLMNRVEREYTIRPTADYGTLFGRLWSEAGRRLCNEKSTALSLFVANIGSFSTCGRTLKQWADVFAEDTMDADASHLLVLVEAFYQNMTFGRRVMKTRSGYVGLAHFGSQVGDTICLLAGCTVPMVLRKEEQGYKFVGEAYVHGVMDGEIWAMRRGEKMEAFDIV